MSTKSKSSTVWQHFSVNPSDENYAICKHCKMQLSRGGKDSKSYTTSSLLKHGFIDRKKLYVSDRIARMIVIDLQPFSIVEDRGFHELLEYLEPRYSMPSR
jgi:hypothetical protein